MTPERAALIGRPTREIRAAIRAQKHTEHAVGLAPGYVACNLAIIPKAHAFDFLTFSQRNPAACPVLEVTDPGDPHTKYLAKDGDLRTDLPRYRVFKNGQVVDEPYDIIKYWREDLVGFLIGASPTFEDAMVQAGLRFAHLEKGLSPAGYVTKVPCEPAGPFKGPLTVSMRPVPAAMVSRVVRVTSRYPGAHGAPIHIGDPAGLGIEDLEKFDFGDAPQIEPGDVPIYWACGVTPQTVAREAKLDLVITHYPSHLFVTDVRTEQIAVC